MNAGEFIKRRTKIEGERGRAAGWQRRAFDRLVREARAEPVFAVAAKRVVAFRLGGGEIVCVKQRFKTEPAAAQSLQMIHEERQPREHVPVRAYHCDHCKGWHITSRPK